MPLDLAAYIIGDLIHNTYLSSSLNGADRFCQSLVSIFEKFDLARKDTLFY